MGYWWRTSQVDRHIADLVAPESFDASVDPWTRAARLGRPVDNVVVRRISTSPYRPPFRVDDDSPPIARSELSCSVTSLQSDLIAKKGFGLSAPFASTGPVQPLEQRFVFSNFPTIYLCLVIHDMCVPQNILLQTVERKACMLARHRLFHSAEGRIFDNRILVARTKSRRGLDIATTRGQVQPVRPRVDCIVHRSVRSEKFLFAWIVAEDETTTATARDGTPRGHEQTPAEHPHHRCPRRKKKR